MNFIRLLPVFISGLLMGAHCMYWGAEFLAIVCAGFPLILIAKKKWAARTVQIYLLVATCEWVRTLVASLRGRIADGENWGRMAMILGVVALFTLLSTCVFFTKSLKERYTL
jgi:hypothetical protein